MKLIAKLLQHPIHIYSYREASILYDLLREMKRAYNAGIPLHVLARQSGLSQPKLKQVFADLPFITVELKRVLDEGSARKSVIFKDKEVLPYLWEKTDLIVDCFQQGYTREEIFLAIDVIPNSRLWLAYKRALKAQGIELEEVENKDTEEITESYGEQYAV